MGGSGGELLNTKLQPIYKLIKQICKLGNVTTGEERHFLSGRTAAKE